MARKPSSRKHSEDKLEELNLAPIMSILVILIPMLIFAFNYTEIVVQNVSLPKTGGVSKKNDKGPKKLKLNVLVSDEGFRVKVQGDPAAGIPPQDKLIPKRQMDGCKEKSTSFMRYDLPALYNEMVKLRQNQALGLEDTINIGAKDRIPWRVLARTIESVRTRREADAYTDLCEFLVAKPKIREETDSDGNTVKIPVELFPKVVFIVL